MKTRGLKGGEPLHSDCKIYKMFWGELESLTGAKILFVNVRRKIIKKRPRTQVALKS